jgi:hypothetical protein
MTAPTMRALTLHAPWAYAVAHLEKRVENRSQPPPRTVLGKRIAIHAGLAEKPAEWTAIAKCIGLPDGKWTGPMATRGAVVATAFVYGWMRSPSDWHTVDGLPPRMGRHVGSPWFVGPVGWLLTQVVTLPEPVPCRGAQGVWFLPADVAEAVARQESIARAA